MKKNPFDKKTFFNNAEEVLLGDLKKTTSCMILAPHPDDESLGCGGLIAMLANERINISLVVTTDGSQSHKHSKSFPPSRLAELRQKEVKNAANILGIAADRIYFLNGKDASLPSKSQEGFSELVELLQQLILVQKPDLFLVPYESDPHCDHRATWQLLQAATKNLQHPKIWEYPIWLYELANKNDIPKLKIGELKKIFIKSFLKQKTEAIRCHVSQTTRIIADDPTGFMLTPEIIAHFITDYEYYFERNEG